MRRRVVKHGSATLTISLPSEWARKYGIQRGDELEIEERGNSLLISTRSDIHGHSADIYLYGPERLTRRLITQHYIRGFDELNIHIDGEDTMQFIVDNIPEFLGYEIIEQGEKYCTIKNIATGVETEVESIIRRLFLMLKILADSSLDAIKKKEYPRLKEIVLLEKTNNKLVHFCERILNTKGYREEHKTRIIYTLVWEIEKICDEFKYICTFLSDPKNKNIKIDEEVLDYYAKVNEMVANFFSLFCKFDKEKLKKTTILREELVNKAYDLFQRKSREQLAVMSHLQHLALKLYDITVFATELPTTLNPEKKKE